MEIEIPSPRFLPEIVDMRVRVDTGSETASEDAANVRPQFLESPAESAKTNARGGSRLGDGNKTTVNPAQSPKNSLLNGEARSKASPYSALHKIMQYHETELQALLIEEFESGRSSRQWDTEALRRVEERAKKAEMERDSAIAEVTSLKRDTKQMLENAWKNGEAAGAARALEDIFAAAKQKYSKPEPEVNGIEALASSKISMQPIPKPRTESSERATVVSEHQRSNGPSVRPEKCSLLSDILAKLPPPMQIKSRKQSLPKWFVETVLCKDDQTFTTKSTDNRGLDVVDWVTIIRIDPEIHESAPDFHKHGALTFVHGDRNSGQTEKARADRVGHEKVESYPVFRYWQGTRTKADGYYYIGHYKVSSLQTIPRTTWESWPVPQKRRVARNLLLSSWGTDILKQKNIPIKQKNVAIMLAPSAFEEEIEDRVDELLLYFYRQEEPNLTMQYTVLKQTQFCFRQCQKVAIEFDFDENGRHIGAPKRGVMEGEVEDEWSVDRDAKRQKVRRDSEESDDLYEPSQ